MIRLFWLGILVAAACHPGRPEPTDAPAQRQWRTTCDTTPLPPPRLGTGGALNAAQRDSLVQEVRAHRAAWQARGITNYRIRIAAGCFCPWPSNPAILEVRNGAAVALLDTTGRSAGAVREPWSAYTVEGLFDAVEHSARSHDVVEVSYDPCLGYPRSIRGDARLGLPDDWFWLRADHLLLPP